MVDTPTGTFADSAVSVNIVDAWGTVKLVAGDFECLRIQRSWVNYGTVSVGGVISQQDTTSGFEYIWFSKTDGPIFSAGSIDDETNPNFTVAAELEALTAVTTDIGETEIEPIPTAIELSQNYPNPFNPATKINFSIQEAGRVSLTVFDLNGRVVRELMEQRLQAGSYSQTWDGVNTKGNKVASGMYVYKLRVNNKVVSKTMMFLK